RHTSSYGDWSSDVCSSDLFPAGYWQLQAQRSGQELGWPLLIAAVLMAFLVIRQVRVRAALGGLALLAMGSLPSAFGYRLPTHDEIGRASCRERLLISCVVV